MKHKRNRICSKSCDDELEEILLDRLEHLEMIIDITIPHDENQEKAEREKQIKYLVLAHETINMWSVDSLRVVVSVNGLMAKSLDHHLKDAEGGIVRYGAYFADIAFSGALTTGTLDLGPDSDEVSKLPTFRQSSHRYNPDQREGPATTSSRSIFYSWNNSTDREIETAVKAHSSHNRWPLVEQNSRAATKHQDTQQRLAEMGNLPVNVQINNINSNQEDMDTRLHDAVELNSIETVKALIEVGLPVNSPNRDGLTPIHICIHKKLPEMLQVLINGGNKKEMNKHPNGALSVRDKDGRTALHSAILAKWMYGVNTIFDAGANILAKDINGETPLHLAATVGDIDILNKILSTKYPYNNINEPNWELETAVIKSVKYGHAGCLKKLLEEKALINTTRRYNVFQLAAANGFEDILQILLDHDNEITREMITRLDKITGFAPIHIAVANNHEKCVETLLSQHTNTNLRTSLTGEHKGATTLHIAAINNRVEIAEMLIGNNRELIHSVNKFNWTPLHHACSNGNRDMIILLLKNGADLSAVAVSLYGKREVTAIELIMFNVVKPTDFLENIFDSYISITSDVDWVNFEVVMNYNLLLPTSAAKDQMKVIDALVKTGDMHKQSRLLAHPLIESFINLKLMAILRIIYTITIIYGIHVTVLTTYVVTVFDNKNNEEHMIQRTVSIPLMRIYISVSLAIIVLLDILFTNISKFRLFTQIETWLKFFAVGLTITLLGSTRVLEGTRQIATVALLLTWIEVMFLLSRIPKWGHYMLMFGKVSRDILKILATFSCLVIGFSLSFMVQFENNPPFDGFWASLIKTLVMVPSGFDYDALITNIIKNNTNIVYKTMLEKYLTPVQIFRITFITFVFLAVIVLMNLMVGVTVNDLHNLETVTNAKRLLNQVEIIISFGTVNKFFRRLSSMPLIESLLERKAISSSMTLKRNETDSIIYKILPSDSIEALFDIAQRRIKKAIGNQNIDDVEAINDERDNPEQLKDIKQKIVRLNNDIIDVKTNVKSLERKIDIILETLQNQRHNNL